MNGRTRCETEVAHSWTPIGKGGKKPSASLIAMGMVRTVACPYVGNEA